MNEHVNAIRAALWSIEQRLKKLETYGPPLDPVSQEAIDHDYADRSEMPQEGGEKTESSGSGPTAQASCPVEGSGGPPEIQNTPGRPGSFSTRQDGPASPAPRDEGEPLCARCGKPEFGSDVYSGGACRTHHVPKGMEGHGFHAFVPPATTGPDEDEEVTMRDAEGVPIFHYKNGVRHNGQLVDCSKCMAPCMPPEPATTGEKPMECRYCGGLFDPSKLDEVLYHNNEPHKPIPATGIVGHEVTPPERNAERRWTLHRRDCRKEGGYGETRRDFSPWIECVDPSGPHEEPVQHVTLVDAAYHDARVKQHGLYWEDGKDHCPASDASAVQAAIIKEKNAQIKKLEAALERVRGLAEGYEQWAEMHGNETYRVFAFDMRRALSATEDK